MSFKSPRVEKITAYQIKIKQLKNKLNWLSPLERKILIAYLNDELEALINQQLLSQTTIEWHIINIMQKLTTDKPL